MNAIKLTSKGLIVKGSAEGAVDLFNILFSYNVEFKGFSYTLPKEVEFNYCYKRKTFKDRNTKVICDVDGENKDKIVLYIIQCTSDKNLINQYPFPNTSANVKSPTDKVDAYIKGIHNLSKIKYDFQKNFFEHILIDIYKTTDTIYEIAATYIDDSKKGNIVVPFSKIVDDFKQGIQIGV